MLPATFNAPTGESEPVKVFERTANRANNQIINYMYDPSRKWLVLNEIAPSSLEALKLEESRVNGSDDDIYLNLNDANRLVDVMHSCSRGNAVVIGGGYIGMKCAASLVINKINVTMVFPKAQ